MSEVTGINETGQQLDALADDVAHMDDVSVAIAAKGVEIIQPLIPVKTGALRASAHGEVIEGKAAITVGNPAITYAPAINARVNFIGRATPAIEEMATQALETGIDTRIKNRGLDT